MARSPSKISKSRRNRQAEEALLWWQRHVWSGSLYVELMRHGQEDEKRANEGAFGVPLAKHIRKDSFDRIEQLLLCNQR